MLNEQMIYFKMANYFNALLLSDSKKLTERFGNIEKKMDVFKKCLTQ